MRHTFWLFTLLIFLFTSCHRKTVEYDNVIEKNGIIFLKGESKPYTGYIIHEEYGLIDKIPVKKGIIHGKGVVKDSSGKVFGKCRYVNNKPHGKWIEYHENGKVWLIDYYKHGKRNGKSKRFSNDGKLEEVYIYKDDKIVDIIYYPNQTEIDSCRKLLPKYQKQNIQLKNQHDIYKKELNNKSNSSLYQDIVMSTDSVINLIDKLLERIEFEIDNRYSKKGLNKKDLDKYVVYNRFFINSEGWHVKLKVDRLKNKFVVIAKTGQVKDSIELMLMTHDPPISPEGIVLTWEHVKFAKPFIGFKLSILELENSILKTENMLIKDIK